ncbi:hypothetical protein QM012_007028 [Aureobasidium pullulans]|uniref:Uncharacterized protein n=1 Tax=Aureobasidium pullulans TaxID=5580 RepID=A0ABR0TLQ9_AURPU
MDDPAFMLLQLQENLQFMRTQFGAHVLSCVTHDSNGEPYWTYVILTYDNHGNVQEYHEPFEGRAEWTNRPLEALKQLHLRVAGSVTRRLVHDCYPRLRTLAQQRYDEEVEHGSSGADNYPNQAHRDSRPQASSSSRFTSERLREPISDPSSYQTHDHLNPARPSYDTLSSGTRDELRKRQGLEYGRAIQPHQFGPAHFLQPFPALGSETWSSRDTNSQIYPFASFKSSANDDSSFQEEAALAQADRIRSAQTHFHTAGKGVRSFASKTTKPARQTSHINASTLPSHQEIQSYIGTRSDLSGTSTQADNVIKARSQLSRSITNADSTPPWISNMHDPRMPSSSYAHPPASTSALPQPLRSHSPASRDPFMIMMDRLTLTEFEEFNRRSDTRERRDSDTLARIEQEAAEYLNPNPAASSLEENTLASLAACLGIHGFRSSKSTSPTSPASDETIIAYNPPHRQRRMTQKRYNSNQTEEPLPPAAQSPPQNTYYPSNIPVYPPTLVTSCSEAPMQRVFSSNANMNRNVSSGEGSVASIVRKARMETHIGFSSSSEEELFQSGNDGKGTRHSAAQRQQSRSEQVRLIIL